MIREPSPTKKKEEAPIKNDGYKKMMLNIMDKCKNSIGDKDFKFIYEYMK